MVNSMRMTCGQKKSSSEEFGSCVFIQGFAALAGTSQPAALRVPLLLSTMLEPRHNFYMDKSIVEHRQPKQIIKGQFLA